MALQLTAEDARQSLSAHVASKGSELHQKYGPRIGWTELKQVLQDRAFVRYPCELAFDSTPLLPGEFACPVQHGESPEEGFTIAIHPQFALQLDQVPALVLYQLVAVNYGDFASPEDAELFGAYALGMDREEYYQRVCACADELAQG
jgi:hypothetical protein